MDVAIEEPSPGAMKSGHSTNKLSDRTIKAFIANTKAGKAHSTTLADGGGMFLVFTPAGTPVWRIKYRYPDPEKGMVQRLYAIGVYPEISLEAARIEREAIRALLREGKDPVKARQVNKAAAAVANDQTFTTVMNDWLEKQKKDWSAIHYTKSKQALERDIEPRLGKLPVAEITPAMIAAAIEVVLNRGVRDTAAKILQHVNGIFRLAAARGMRSDNPAVPVREILPKPERRGRRPALLTFPELGDVLRRAEVARLSPAVRMAHRLCAFTVARISNIVEARWTEFDLDATPPTWIIPRAQMKSKEPLHDHKVVLGSAIVEELRQWRHLIGGTGYLFPSPAVEKQKHISRESVEKAYRETLALRDKHCPHGWRSALSSIARDSGREREVIELTLDHVHDDEVARAYDRGERLTKRIELMTWWNEQLVTAQQEQA